jgi:hypothetical protein
MMVQKTVVIGGASGAWGDSPRAIGQLLAASPDYLMMDYLAEVTMSLLARARLKDPAHGFPPDFVGYLKPHLQQIAGLGTRVVSNAGGVNPAACKAALEAACREAGVALRVAMVDGDDLLPQIDALRPVVREHVSGQPLPPQLLTANAYLGALPIKAALDAGADIVVTGRCADSALALGVLMHEFGWSAHDYDLLAAGSLVGHLLECGPQATGGNHTDWQDVPGWEDIGYPLAECHADGTFVLTKPAGTGGLITPGVAAEQTLYEIGDPAAYILPDVIADFSQVVITRAGENRVAFSGARGRAPTASYKVSATWQDGYRAVASISIVGPDAVAKAEKTAAALIARGRLIFAERGLPDFTETLIEPLGAEAAYGPLSQARQAREVLLRVVVSHPDAKALGLFARELGSMGLSTAPGVTGIYGGRPKPGPVVRLFTFFVDKAVMPSPRVFLADAPPFAVTIPAGAPVTAVPAAPEPPVPPASGDLVAVPLLRLAYARSGDKGDSANIAIIARRPEWVETIRREVTPARLATLFPEVAGPIHRFAAPGLNAFNFLLEAALGGGGMASLRIDPQGKAYGQRALELPVNVSADLLDHDTMA